MAAKINISRLLSQISDFGHDANRSAVSVTNETTQSMVTQAQLRVTSNNSVDNGQLRLSIGKTTARVGIIVHSFFLMLLMQLMLNLVLAMGLEYRMDFHIWQSLLGAKKIEKEITELNLFLYLAT
jgi:hypothetical protein